MSPALKKSILTNKFADGLLEYRIDESAYRELCALLEQLAEDWRGNPDIDKEVVLDMYHTTHIVRNRELHFRENGQEELGNQLEDIFIELDRLFGEDCLRSAPEGT